MVLKKAISILQHPIKLFTKSTNPKMLLKTKDIFIKIQSMLSCTQSYPEAVQTGSIGYYIYSILQ